MRKKYTFSALLSLFLLVPASITWAQTISSQKGLTTAVFTTSSGSIKLYLPTDIRLGDLISGSVVTEPVGKNTKQTANNLSELKKYSISINGEKIALDNTNKPFQFYVNADRPMTGQIELINSSGIKTGELTIPTVPEKSKQTAPAQCKMPSHALTGSPFRITGPFDGNSSNANCMLDNIPMEILTKSSRECIVFYPADATGIKTLNVQENGKQICSQQVSGVKLNVSAGKLDLMKGEETYINVSITGLQNLPDTALLTLTNTTTGVVVMQPSNMIVIPLSPDSVGSGAFNKTFDIQSIRTGSFSVLVNLDLPEHPGTEAQPNQPTQPQCPGCICSCFVTIELLNTVDGISTYHAKVTASCSGYHGKLPCTGCGIVDAFIYEWSINSEDEKVIITAGDNEVFVKTKNPNNSPFVLSVTITVTCSDNSQCTCTGEIEGGPPVPEPDKGSCACDGSCSIIQIGAGPGSLKFQAVVKAECKGYSGKGSTKVSCDVKWIDYLWHIAKNDVIGIDGNTR